MTSIYVLNMLFYHLDVTYSITNYLHSDNGLYFDGKSFNTLDACIECKHLAITASHYQANGLVKTYYKAIVTR